MANRADVYVKNSLADSIQLVRKLPNGKGDLEAVVAHGSKEGVHLPGPEVSLEIKTPKKVDTKECVISVKADVDMTITYSRTDSRWSLKIDPNDLPPTAPTTVNVNIGEDEPE